VTVGYNNPPDTCEPPTVRCCLLIESFDDATLLLEKSALFVSDSLDWRRKAGPVGDNCASNDGAEKDSVPVASPCISVQPPQCHTALRQKSALKERETEGVRYPQTKNSPFKDRYPNTVLVTLATTLRPGIHAILTHCVSVLIFLKCSCDGNLLI